jgi:hypothetical protein
MLLKQRNQFLPVLNPAGVRGKARIAKFSFQIQKLQQTLPYRLRTHSNNERLLIVSVKQLIGNDTRMRIAPA